MGANSALPNGEVLPERMRIEKARRDLSVLCDSAHVLRREGRSSANLELAIRDKRAELNDLINGQAPLSTALDGH